jgi:hypothetical protein
MTTLARYSKFDNIDTDSEGEGDSKQKTTSTTKFKGKNTALQLSTSAGIELEGRRREAHNTFTAAEQRKDKTLYAKALSQYKTLLSSIAEAIAAGVVPDDANTGELGISCTMNCSACHARLEQWVEAIQFAEIVLGWEQTHTGTAPPKDEHLFSAKYFKVYALGQMSTAVSSQSQSQSQQSQANFMTRAIDEVKTMAALIKRNSPSRTAAAAAAAAAAAVPTNINIKDWHEKHKELENSLLQAIFERSQRAGAPLLLTLDPTKTSEAVRIYQECAEQLTSLGKDGPALLLQMKAGSVSYRAQNLGDSGTTYSAMLNT